jgi:hypothetical protein
MRLTAWLTLTGIPTPIRGAVKDAVEHMTISLDPVQFEHDNLQETVTNIVTILLDNLKTKYYKEIR